MKKIRLLILLICLLVLPKINAFGDVNTVGISVNTPSQSEIIQFIRNHPTYIGTNTKVTYDEVPSVRAPYSAGKVNQKFLTEGLNGLNNVRFIAGIPADVALEPDFTELCQAGSVVNAGNNRISHTPSKPAGMSDELYNEGCQGTGRSNLAQGFALLSSSIVFGYMNDGDASNIEVLGHRRWAINPAMGVTGFGFTPNDFSSMYSFDDSRGLESKYAVTSWPAQNMPVEYFGAGYPFSLSLSEDFDKLSRGSVQVKMTRASDGKVFYFNNQSSNSVDSTDYFNVNNEGYGQPRCIIWRPDVSSYKSGERYSIEVTGVKKNGRAYPISYNVNFFSLNGTNSNNGSGNGNSTYITPQISNVTLSLTKFNPAKETLKISFKTNRSGSYYCKVYDENKNLVNTLAKGFQITSAGNWWTNWKGTNSNGKTVNAGKYRITLYLVDGKVTSAIQNVYVNVLGNGTATTGPKVSNFYLSSESFSPANGEQVQVNFTTDKACAVYCYVYDGNNNNVAVVAKGLGVTGGGTWYIPWCGFGNNGNLNAGSYRMDIYGVTNGTTGNKLSLNFYINE